MRGGAALTFDCLADQDVVAAGDRVLLLPVAMTAGSRQPIGTQRVDPGFGLDRVPRCGSGAQSRTMIGMLTARASVARDAVDRCAECAGRPRFLDRTRYRASVQPDVIGAASVCARHTQIPIPAGWAITMAFHVHDGDASVRDALPAVQCVVPAV
ncbi:hypothetical protein ACQUKI_02620 [Ralstonia pseudosolanacearum]